MTIPDIIYALHEQIITRDEARHLIDALAHMELSVSLEATGRLNQLEAAIPVVTDGRFDADSAIEHVELTR